MTVKIEKHYGRPMDIEWARNGDDGELYGNERNGDELRLPAAAASCKLRLRAAAAKHGRVAVYAAMGFITPGHF
eukprot:13790997-Heterocapsa_arctica.AAC.1